MEQLLRPDGRKGIAMPKNRYERLKAFILSFLDDEHETTLNELLEKGIQTDNEARLESEKSWSILQVKLDLEACGLIRAFVPEYSRKTNYLKITRQGQKVLRQERMVGEPGL